MAEKRRDEAGIGLVPSDGLVFADGGATPGTGTAS